MSYLNFDLDIYEFAIKRGSITHYYEVVGIENKKDAYFAAKREFIKDYGKKFFSKCKFIDDVTGYPRTSF